jgi:hypothetical protein
MYELKVDYQKAPLQMRACQTTNGQLMKVIEESSAYCNHILLHIGGVFVSLTDTKLCWNDECSLDVELLPIGTVVNLIVQ